jgi:hypothetical protein
VPGEQRAAKEVRAAECAQGAEEEVWGVRQGWLYASIVLIMALYSMFVDCDGLGSFSTQLSSPTPQSAVRKLLKGTAIYEFCAKQKDWPKNFSDKDISLFIPMNCLVNMHLCQISRKGKYVSVTLVKTVPSRKNPHN